MIPPETTVTWTFRPVWSDSSRHHSRQLVCADVGGRQRRAIPIDHGSRGESAPFTVKVNVPCPATVPIGLNELMAGAAAAMPENASHKRRVRTHMATGPHTFLHPRLVTLRTSSRCESVPPPPIIRDCGVCILARLCFVSVANM